MRGWILYTLIFCGFAWGQNESANLTGTITDSSGAAAVRAAVRLTNTETGETYQSVTSDTGSYDFQLLKPGHYNLTVEMAGFKQFVQTGITLETGVPARVDVRLEVGALTEKVTVEATASLIQTESSAVGSVVENRTIIDMPLIDRRGAQLAKLSGFVVQNTTGSSPQFSMGGGRGNNANWRMDGGSNNNILLGLPAWASIRR